MQHLALASLGLATTPSAPSWSAVAFWVLAALLSLPMLRTATLKELNGRRSLRAPLLFVWFFSLASFAIVAALSQAVAGVLLVVGGCVYSALLWRGRERFGSRGGLPPGSLSLRESLAALGQVDFYADRARRHGSVFKVSQFHRPTVAVLGIADGTELLRLHRDQLSGSPLPFSRFVEGGFLRYLKGVRHKTYARAFRKAFEPGILNPNEQGLRRLIQAQIAQMASEDGCDPRAHLQGLSFRCLSLLVCGLDQEDPRFLRWQQLFEHCGSQLLSNPARAKRAQAQFDALVAEILESLQKLPPLERPPVAMSSVAESALTEGVDVAALRGNLLFMFLIGVSNVAAFLAWVLKDLSDNPEILQGLARQLSDQDPAAQATAEAIVSESLRLHQSEYIYRQVDQEFCWRGFRFPKGWLVRVCVRESHRDGTIFESPNLFQPERFLQNAPDRQTYAPLGLDNHACLGAGAARFVARCLVEELARSGPWSTVGDGAPQRGDRHWHHWEPNAGFRISWAPNQREQLARIATEGAGS